MMAMCWKFVSKDNLSKTRRIPDDKFRSYYYIMFGLETLHDMSEPSHASGAKKSLVLQACGLVWVVVSLELKEV